MKKGDLASAIKKCKKEGKIIPEETVWNLFAQLLSALSECHHGTKNSEHPAILHRDIKPENVFLDGNYNVKLGDFGLSRVVGDPNSDFARTYVGTPFYMSPELVNESSYNSKSDIWALGCLIYELCTLEPPFQAKTQAGLQLRIRQGKVDDLPSQYYSRELSRVIKAMLNVHQEKRPSTLDVMKLDKIKLILRERELHKIHIEFKAREEELQKKITALQQKEAKFHALMEQKEQELNAKKTMMNSVSVSVSTQTSPKPSKIPIQIDDELEKGLKLNPFQKRNSSKTLVDTESPHKPRLPFSLDLLIEKRKSFKKSIPDIPDTNNSPKIIRSPFNEKNINSTKITKEDIPSLLFSKISINGKKDYRDTKIKSRNSTLHHLSSPTPNSSSTNLKDRDILNSPLAPRRRISMAHFESPKPKSNLAPSNSKTPLTKIGTRRMSFTPGFSPMHVSP